jgi:hypothetical protein
LDTYPIYYFAASSPFVKYPTEMNKSDEILISAIIDKPIDERANNHLFQQDPLEQMERFMANERKNDLTPPLFHESHSSMPLKEYVRKSSNWVLDFHWIFTLNYFIDLLPANKLYYFIKNYPSLDNFILYWMWWSYSLNKELERIVKDPFRCVGSMPWLELEADQQLSSINCDIEKNKTNTTPQTNRCSYISFF